MYRLGKGRFRRVKQTFYPKFLDVMSNKMESFPVFAFTNLIFSTLHDPVSPILQLLFN